jgi:uncharacterized protein YdeI (YjbR/CyaY-like superfamily)
MRRSAAARSRFIISAMQPMFFATPPAFRRWLVKNHETASELLVGFYKRDSGKPSITWPESVDEALCFGWIDGVRRRIDDESYSIRFTPRRKRSIWSAVNIRRATELGKLGLMQPAGLRAFEARTENKSRLYSYESETKTLPPAADRKFRANKRAWRYFSDQPPGYRRIAIHWVVSAKKEETRERRLATLIEDSANERRIALVTLAKKK